MAVEPNTLPNLKDPKTRNAALLAVPINGKALVPQTLDAAINGKRADGTAMTPAEQDALARALGFNNYQELMTAIEKNIPFGDQKQSREQEQDSGLRNPLAPNEFGSATSIWETNAFFSAISSAYNSVLDVVGGFLRQHAPSGVFDFASRAFGRVDMTQVLPGEAGRILSALGSIESGGLVIGRVNYHERGTICDSHLKEGIENDLNGRALGAYQVMADEVAEWAARNGHPGVTPREFFNDPKLQDEICLSEIKHLLATRNRFGRYNTPQDVASIWLTGRPVGAVSANASDGGITQSGYVSRFSRFYNRLEEAAAVAETNPVQDAAWTAQMAAAHGNARTFYLDTAMAYLNAIVHPTSQAECVTAVRGALRRAGLDIPDGTFVGDPQRSLGRSGFIPVVASKADFDHYKPQLGDVMVEMMGEHHHTAMFIKRDNGTYGFNADFAHNVKKDDPLGIYGGQGYRDAAKEERLSIMIWRSPNIVSAHLTPAPAVVASHQPAAAAATVATNNNAAIPKTQPAQSSRSTALAAIRSEQAATVGETAPAPTAPNKAAFVLNKAFQAAVNLAGTTLIPRSS